MKEYYYMILIFLVALALVFATAAKAAEQDSTHEAAHIGTAYTINIVTYGFYSRAFKMDRVPAFVFSTFLTTMIGMSYKMLEPHVKERDVLQAMGRNAIGQALCAGTVFVFKF